MKRMTTLKNHERRITALESRGDKIEEVLASHSESLYLLKRFAVRTDLRFDKLLKHFNIEDVPVEQVDEVLDAE